MKKLMNYLYDNPSDHKYEETMIRIGLVGFVLMIIAILL